MTRAAVWATGGWLVTLGRAVVVVGIAGVQVVAEALVAERQSVLDDDRAVGGPDVVHSAIIASAIRTITANSPRIGFTTFQ
jgi:hypothetical protein